jgi:hypothetical protein
MRRLATIFVSIILWVGLISARPGWPASPWQDSPESPVETAQWAEPALQSGCQITGAEPGRISPLTGGSLSVYGTGFVQGTAVRLVGYGLLAATVINTMAISAVVPPGLPERTYTLVVALPDGSSCRLGDALRIRIPAAERPTATPQPGRPVTYGRPQLVIEAAGTQPEPIQPGGVFSLTLQIVNRGDYTANNVRVALGSGSIAIPKSGSDLTVIDQIGNDQAIELELLLALSKEAPPGYQNLALALEYSDYLGRSYQSAQSVGISVNTSLSDQPLVLLSSYHTQPESLSPGEVFTLVLELTNAGDSEAQQLLVTLGGESTAEAQTFAILDSGNVKLVPRLAPGESIGLEQRFILDGSASAGVYILPVTLAYDSPARERRTEKQVLNLLVNRRPQLKVDFYREIQPGLPGNPLELPIEIVNIGRNAVNVSTADVSGENLEITRGSAFIGYLEGGTTASLDAVIVPQLGGSLPVIVSIHYLDDFNKPQVITQTLTIEVETPLPTPEVGAVETPQGGEGQWEWVVKLLRGLFGLGS